MYTKAGAINKQQCPRRRQSPLPPAWGAPPFRPLPTCEQLTCNHRTFSKNRLRPSKLTQRLPGKEAIMVRNEARHSFGSREGTQRDSICPFVKPKARIQFFNFDSCNANWGKRGKVVSGRRLRGFKNFYGNNSLKLKSCTSVM